MKNRTAAATARTWCRCTTARTYHVRPPITADQGLTARPPPLARVNGSPVASVRREPSQLTTARGGRSACVRRSRDDRAQLRPATGARMSSLSSFPSRLPGLARRAGGSRQRARSRSCRRDQRNACLIVRRTSGGTRLSRARIRPQSHSMVLAWLSAGSRAAPTTPRACARSAVGGFVAPVARTPSQESLAGTRVGGAHLRALVQRQKA